MPKGAAALRGLTIVVPHGLSFVRHRAGKHLVLTGIRVNGAKVASLSVVHGRLVIKLRRAARSFTLRIGPAALEESPALKTKVAARKVRRLVVTLIASNTAHRRSTLHVRFAHLGR